MARFSSARKGYNKNEVDEYLHTNTEFLEGKIRDLQGRIEQLKEENNYLYVKNGEFRRNEERVASAIIKAMEIKDKIENEMRAKAEMEGDRLRIFKEKWVTYAKGINNSNANRVVEDIDAYIEEFRNGFITKINTDLNIKSKDNTSNTAEIQYKVEQKRLSKLKQKSEAAYSVEDASTIPPKESLEELCKYLGLMED